MESGHWQKTSCSEISEECELECYCMTHSAVGFFVIFLAIKTFQAEVALPGFQSATAYGGEISRQSLFSPHCARDLHQSL